MSNLDSIMNYDLVMLESDYNDQMAYLEYELGRVEQERICTTNRLNLLLKQRDELKRTFCLMKLSQMSRFSQWVRVHYPWALYVRRYLKLMFKFNYFRPTQIAAINATLSNQDVIVVMPPGAGKSLIYQLSSVVREGVSVFISPLKTLLEEQYRTMSQSRISAKIITGEDVNASNLSTILPEGLDVILITPDILTESQSLILHLQSVEGLSRLSRFVIDEVHCCSDCSHDYRSDYKQLSLLKRNFPNIPILGLTATASDDVITDIQKVLNINQEVIMASTFNMPNLFYGLVKKPLGKTAAFAKVLNRVQNKYAGKRGIVFTTTSGEVYEIASYLRDAGISVVAYVSYMTDMRKKIIHKEWHDNKYQVIVTSPEFGVGMGEFSY